MFLEIIFSGIIAILVFVYVTGRNNEKYWQKRGVKFYKKNKITGIFWDYLTQNGAMFERFNDLYKEYKNEPAIGIGLFFTPALYVIHPKNVQHVLQTDFGSFYHRGLDINKGDQLADNILLMNGPRWKLMRQSMTPLFSSSKLKSMYYIIDKSAQDLVQYLKENPKTLTGGGYDTLMTYSNASVCGAIFGVGSESVFDSPFLEVVKDITKPKLINDLRFAIMTLSPSLSHALGIKIFKEYEEFLINAVTKVIQQREKENVKRHDFADVCVAIRKNGIMKDPSTGTEIEPTYAILAAQAMFFLIAGVEPVAVTLFTALTELGRHPDILEKLQQEIDEKFVKHGKNLTYDIISEMTYVDKVLNETLRRNPPLGYLSRQCVKDSVLPVGNIKIEKGTKIFTPIYDIHHDPEFFPEPYLFDPERFAAGNKPSDEIYMPFGMGNRMCIGARFAKLQTAAGLVHVLRHFTVKTRELSSPSFKSHFNLVRRNDADVELIPRNVN